MTRILLPRFLLLSLFALCSADLIKQISSIDEFESTVISSDSIWLVQFCSRSSKCFDLGQIATIVRGIYYTAVVKDDDGAVATKYGLSSSTTTTSSPSFYLFSHDKTKPRKYDPTSGPSALDNINGVIQTLVDETIAVFQARAPSASSSFQSSSSSGGDSSSSRIVQATSANYDQVVLNNPNVVLVAFTAPWCGYCKKLMPEWEEAAKRLDGEDVTLVNVDATQEEDLARQYGIEGFPTIKYFVGNNSKSKRRQHGDAQTYQGQRETRPIVEFAMHLVDTTGIPKPIPELVTQQVFEETCYGHNKICVLAVLPHILDSGAEGRNKYRDMLARVQKQFRGASGAFAFVWMEGGSSQVALEEALELTFGYPALVALSVERQAYAVLRGSFQETKIASFLNGVTTGRQRTVPLRGDGGLPAIVTVEPWDGKDGEVVEEEMSLAEIMGWDDDDDDDDKPKEEL